MESTDLSTDLMGGTLVFRGTRVPVQTLADYLAARDTLTDFVDDFPAVFREKIVGAVAQGLAKASARKGSYPQITQIDADYKRGKEGQEGRSYMPSFSIP